MNIQKSHFTFTRKQRNGIFLLVTVIVFLQVAFYLYDKSLGVHAETNFVIDDLQKEVDSLKLVQLQKLKPKVYPFNPNYITDYKGYTLGMSNEEIDRLHHFRATEKWVNSAKDFQQVTKVSDSLLERLSPYFKFPDWVTNPKPKNVNQNYDNNNNNNNNKPKTFAEKIDLNTVTASQLKRVYGVGEKLSERIINYREEIGSIFIADIQLTEVYGLSPEVILRIKEQFTVKTPKSIQLINLNTATRDQLVNINYIDYEVAHNIIEQRTLRDGFQSLNDLTKVKDFPVSKFEIITLYLLIE
ncbi:helix-hairpin-helix domain-containing protein [Bizionia argentinensis JUB59]|uniref:Helix-hairpin-helix domain-containing protein n=1 Tax=Bizionia argentinensis JUB59 TaxID=1046627 RepID=G2EG54_9FLAO|nr:helix-hairpin-helix domain-containing protein [Bizionia argentinensis]EGV42585.1 helix-hairpin-helix domain-containing protein [Bizionia argentinensis JUB59]